ncbi:protein-glucosylgalactosylhydroxylysine glucosidase isoform X2 [Eupeodes corollae]|uniref:protein-glucosylgalactosylhydroxylysine glucosidase isoform X2 n=1 Tax=Eupeodes corollae TaxID=290404 RepID=UPI0024904EFF|nr:protein-glucosylgalactosylhydroxylysine glucosidase isoform X2 [Eupeodes corollae]
MHHQLRLFIFFTFLCYASVAIVNHSEAISDSPYILESKSLPDDINFMPTLGNGHLGFTIFGDSIFVNGVYNGKGGNSHRARIQNVANISVIQANGEAITKESYKLDLYNGYFERKQSNSEIEITIRTYPHRYFNRAIINEIFVQRLNNTSSDSKLIKLLIDVQPGPVSEDFNPEPVARVSENTELLCQQTKETENDHFQSFKPYVCLARHIGSDHLELLPNQKSLYERIVVAIGETSVIAVKELNEVLCTSRESLIQLHSQQWNTFWKEFSIDLDGNLELSHTINAGIFYIASSLPSPKTFQKPASYFGLSPTGLGRGNLDNDYQGHNFWDTEIWMLPAVTQLSTNWTRDLLDYRFRMLKAAIDHANKTGYPGARFPWESALTGTEVTNPCCPEVALHQFHITADIAFAVRHYLIVTNDTPWMKEKGCELTKRIAEFWINRVSWNEITRQYDIKDVMGPDEDHENVTNNAYTNVVVQHALKFINDSQIICETDPSFVAKCLDIAEKLKIPYDIDLDYHPQYDNYIPEVIIKQADAVLLSYPMLYPMNRSTLSNNLRIYEKVTRPTGPAMTWSMYAIGHLDEGNKPKADKLFEKGYKDYVREPFKVWSEVIRGKEGAANFITGIGGFLQTIVNGYGGVRFHLNRMEIKKPNILPGTKSSIISGIHYHGSIFKIQLSSKPTLTVVSIKDGQKLRLIDEKNGVKLMTKGIEYSLENDVSVEATES